jgi:tetraacyldisaccharide 4'-kinase
LYRLGLTMCEIKLRSGLKPVRQLGWPVVSIGNLSTGGSGKTPLVIALAKALAARGLCVDVLSRGYSRRSALSLLVDIRGTAETFGDEPLLTAREANVPVFVAAERYEAGRMAEKQGPRDQATSASKDRSPRAPAGNKRTSRLAALKGHDFSRAVISKEPIGPSGPDGCFRVHLLDDGFQHRQLHRDVDILLLSRADLNDHLLPAGNLREALRAAGRAHVIAVPTDEADVEAEIRSRGLRADVWRVRRHMEIPPLDGPVAAFCGIARPEQFFDGLEAASVQIAVRTAFRDHYNYTAQDLSRLAAEARSAGASALLTTEKDRVRIGALALSLSLPLKTVQLRIEIENEGEVIDWLIDKLGSSRLEPRM